MYFSPGTQIFMWEKIISELFIIYLFIIPSSGPHTTGDQLPVWSINDPGGSWGKGGCSEHTAGLEAPCSGMGLLVGHPHLPAVALAPSGWLGSESPDCSFSSTISDEIPDSISLSSSQHFTSPSSKWQCVLCSSKLSAVAHHSNNSQPLRLLLLFVGRRPGERWEEITQHHFPSLAYRETGESWEPEFSYVTCPSQQTLNGSM